MNVLSLFDGISCGQEVEFHKISQEEWDKICDKYFELEW